MRRQDAIALGLSAVTVGALATTAMMPRAASAALPPAPPTARRAWVARPAAPVRQAPAANAPVLGQLSQGDPILIDPTETSFPGFVPIVRESLTDTGVRFTRNLGWMTTDDVSFAPVSEAPPSAIRGLTQVGTIAGHHSLAETRDLLAVADYRFRTVARELASPEARAADAAVRAQLDVDWKVLAARWAAARKEIARNLQLKRLASPIFFSADMVPTEDEWVRTLGFVQGQELVRGSLQDITYRLERVLGRQILFENQPSQTTADVDLDLFKDLDADIRAGEDVARRAATATKDAVTSPTGLAIGGVLLTVGAGALALVFLPEILAARRAASTVRRRA